MKLTLFLFILSITLFNCAGGGGSNPATTGPAIVNLLGQDMSGAYTLKTIACFDASGRPTNAATVVGTFSDVLSVSGNSFTEQSTDGVCTVNFTGSIEFTGSNIRSLTNQKIVSASGGSCTIKTTLGNSAITPNIITQTFSTGGTQPDSSATYVWDQQSKTLATLTNLSDGGAGDKCYIEYSKQ